MNASVDLVHRQLECLKYVGGFTPEKVADGSRGTPSGQGVAIEIALMPDLLLDVRTYNIDEATEGASVCPRTDANGRIFAVGGRAARTACALLHLLDEDDGTFAVHLITRTGNLGKLLLQDEFHRSKGRRQLSTLSLDTVLDREGEPRGAIIPKRRLDDDQGLRPQESQKELELQDEHLRTPSVSAVLDSARVIGLCSIKTPSFDSLFAGVRQWLLRPSSGQLLFIDTDRARPGDLVRLWNALKETSRSVKKRTVIFLRRSDERTLLQAYNECRHGLQDPTEVGSIKDLCARCRIQIVEYGEPGGTSWIDWDGNTAQIQQVSFAGKTCSPDFSQEDIAEYFKAGVMLAKGLRSTVEDLAADGLARGYAESLLHEWPQAPKSPWESILEYGVCLARARETTSDLEHFTNHLLSGEPKEDSCHWPLGSTFKPVSLGRVETGKTNTFPLESKNLGSAVLSRLAGHRRLGANWDLAEPLARCSEPRFCPGVCPKTSGDYQRAAVLIDLDSTLMDSTEQRNRGLAGAFTELHRLGVLTTPEGRLVTREDVSTWIDEFTKNVYDRYELYAALQRRYGHLALGDFRQEWNHTGWYVTFLMFHQANADLQRKIEKSLEDRTEDEPLDRVLDSAGWCGEFCKQYEAAAEKYRDNINEARRAFERVRMYPFKEARDFLSSLKASGAFWLYVVSEGSPHTQWMKIQKTGLDEFFDRQHVLTTGDAAELVDERHDLALEEAALKARLGNILQEEQREIAFSRCLAELELRGEVAAQRKLKSLRVASEGASRNMQKAIESALDTERVRDIFDEQKKQIRSDVCELEESRERIEKQLQAARFARMVLDRLDNKEGGCVYAAAMRAILRNPKQPLSVLRCSGKLMSGHPRDVKGEAKLKFVMIGDRQHNDIEPPASLLRHDRLLTIRLVAGKYAAKEPPGQPTPHPPTFLAYTLAQVKAILLSKDTWGAIGCALDPPMFNWVVNTKDREYFPDPKAKGDYTVGLNHLLRGIAIPDPMDTVDPVDGPEPVERPVKEFTVIRRLCIGVLSEHLASLPHGSIVNTLESYLLQPELLDDSERTMALCALSEVEGLHADELAKMRAWIRERLMRISTRRGIRRAESLQVERALDRLGACARREADRS